MNHVCAEDRIHIARRPRVLFHVEAQGTQKITEVAVGAPRLYARYATIVCIARQPFSRWHRAAKKRCVLACAARDFQSLPWVGQESLKNSQKHLTIAFRSWPALFFHDSLFRSIAKKEFRTFQSSTIAGDRLSSPNVLTSFPTMLVIMPDLLLGWVAVANGAVLRSALEDTKLQRIVEHSAPIILQIDASSKIQFAAGYHLATLGLSPQSLLGSSISQFISAHEPTLHALRLALRGEFGTTELKLAGRHFEVRLTPMSDASGAIAHVTTVFIDITERARSAEELRRSEASFRDLIESSPDAVIVHRFGKIVYANEATKVLLHYDALEDIMGHPVLEFFSRDDRPLAAQRINDSTSSSESFSDRFHLLRKSGEQSSFEVTTMAVQYHGENATVHVARDITQSLRMQTKLAQTERLASLGTLAGGVGHEINNPLAYMTANLSFLAEELLRLLPPDDNEDNAELHHALRDVQDGTGRVKDIVRQLNEFSRVDSNVEELIDPRTSIEAAVRMSWNHVRRSARLRTRLSPVAAVRGNSSRLGQVFLALLLNASQALEGTHISRSVIEISSYESEDEVIILVQDCGPGIPDEILTNIFDPFFSARAGGQGTGLGLSVAHSIVTEMGGHIDISTKLGEGTTVQISLPRAQERFDEASSGKSILVVTDDVRLLEATQIALRGHDIRIAGRMSIASPELDNAVLDAVLCDVSSADVDIAVFAKRAIASGGVLLWLSQQLDQVTSAHRELAATSWQKPIGADNISMQLSKLWASRGH